MRQFFEVINDYPWTTFFVWIMCLSLVAIISTIFENKNKL